MTNQIIVKMVLDAWNSKIKDADNLFDSLSDEQLNSEVAPKRNRGVYLLGHLAAVNDRMLPLLSFGDQMYPELNEPFLTNPDNPQAKTATAKELKQYWKTINAKLNDQINKAPTDEWFQKHNSVSSEDFAKEPHRNKLNILINRTNHLSYHLGQLAFLKK